MNVLGNCWECTSRNGYPTRFSMKEFEEHNSKNHIDCKNKCKICPCVFFNYKDMEEHVKNDHHSFICIECFEEKGLEKYYSKKELSKHYAIEHEHSKWKCSTCFNRFKLEKTLEDHDNLFHRRNSKPVVIKCVNCPNFSGTRVDLDRHNADRHPKKMFPYMCSKCGNVFKQSATCDVHKNEDCSLRS